MNNNQFVLIVNGTRDSGSNEVISILNKRLKQVFLIASNRIKFLISDYTPDRDRKMVQEIAVIISEKVLNNGFSIIVEGGSIEQKNFNKKITDLAGARNIKVITVNIEAPVEIMKQKFFERIEESKAIGKKVSVTNEEELMKRINAYFDLKDEKDPTFDSSKESIDEITKKILSLM